MLFTSTNAQSNTGYIYRYIVHTVGGSQPWRNTRQPFERHDLGIVTLIWVSVNLVKTYM